MNEIKEFEKLHPRAIRLLRKKKNFIVISEDEPYFMQGYELIRTHEISKSTWSAEDEKYYQDAKIKGN